MEDVLIRLLRAASIEEAVAVQELTNGMQLIAYPLEKDFLVVVGYGDGSQSALSVEELVRRRSDDIARYSAWLPAMFADNTLHVVRRLNDVDTASAVPPLSTEELLRAVELLK